MNSELHPFIEWVRPEGATHIEFLAYGIFDANKSQLPKSSVLANWPAGTEVHAFALEDESWPVAMLLWEVHSPEVPNPFEEALSQPLIDLVRQGARLAWYMFDAAFGGLSPLFSRWHVEQTYGICIPDHAPRLALTRNARQSDEWAGLLAAAQQKLYALYPQLGVGGAPTLLLECPAGNDG